MKTVKLITCDDAFQAHVIQGALKNEGIASVLHNENMSSVMRGYVRDVTGVDIFVYALSFIVEQLIARSLGAAVISVMSTSYDIFESH